MSYRLLGVVVLLSSLLTPCVVTGLELNGLDPTLFNFASDLVGIAIQLVFSLCLASCYGLFLTQHIQGNKTIPLKALGSVPSDLLGGLTNAWSMRNLLSLPIIGFTVLLAVNQFSHAIADLGLSFVTSINEGPPKSVLSLAVSDRNQQILFEAVGDPTNRRTDVEVAAFVDEESKEWIEQSARVASFIYAVDNMAKGVSSLLSPASLFVKNEGGKLGRRYTLEGTRYEGILNPNVTKIFHAPDVQDDSFLVGINMDLPLDCDKGGMVEIEQTQGGIFSDTSLITNTALVPACSFDRLRSTGMYYETNERVEITSYLYHFMKDSFDGDFSVVTSGGKHHDIFMIAPPWRNLARDRDDFRSGRVLGDIIAYDTLFSAGRIEAINFGNVSIPVESVVYATGKHSGSSNDIELTQYGLVAEIAEGGCPEDPGGRFQPSCLAILSLQCQTFPEDEAISLEDIRPGDISLCLLFEIEILWGRNFKADKELVVAVAGVYGRTRSSLRGQYETLMSSMHSIPAAMMMLSSIKQVPSRNEVIIPEINMLYIVFMLLPLVIASFALLWGQWFKDRSFVIPDEPWKMTVLGNETDPLPSKRNHCHEEFPETVSDLQYGVIGHDTKAQRVLIGIILPGNQQQGGSSGTTNTVPSSNTGGGSSLPTPTSVSAGPSANQTPPVAQQSGAAGVQAPVVGTPANQPPQSGGGVVVTPSNANTHLPTTASTGTTQNSGVSVPPPTSTTVPQAPQMAVATVPQRPTTPATSGTNQGSGGGNSGVRPPTAAPGATNLQSNQQSSAGGGNTSLASTSVTGTTSSAVSGPPTASSSSTSTATGLTSSAGRPPASASSTGTATAQQQRPHPPIATGPP